MQAKRLQNSCCTVCDQKRDCGQEQSGKFKDNWAFLVYFNVFIYLTSHLLLVLRTVSNRRPLANENRHSQRLDRDNEGRQSETQGCTLRVPLEFFTTTLTSVSLTAVLPLRRPMSDIIRGQPQVFVNNIKFHADLNHNSQILSASSFYPHFLKHLHMTTTYRYLSYNFKNFSSLF